LIKAIGEELTGFSNSLLIAFFLSQELELVTIRDESHDGIILVHHFRKPSLLLEQRARSRADFAIPCSWVRELILDVREALLNVRYGSPLCQLIDDGLGILCKRRDTAPLKNTRIISKRN